MFSRLYSLYKSHQILVTGNGIYEKQKDSLPTYLRQDMESSLSSLQEAILQKDRTSADTHAKHVEEITAPYVHHSWWRSLVEILITLVVALLVATLIRQVWFEPYKIPTGSMRPTFREEDALTVTKTAFGINTPLDTSHLYFDPTLVLRTGAFTFTADNLDMTDIDTHYFWLFPAKKQLVKRCMGLPKDSLYFYGGKLYGVNEHGEDVTPLLNPGWMEKMDHVPYVSFLGRKSLSAGEAPRTQELLIRQMNMPLAKLVISPQKLQGLIQVNNEWIPDNPYEALKTRTKPVTYSDFFGIGNYAMARLLTAAEAQRFSSEPINQLGKASFYLELYHHPYLTYPLSRLVTGSGNTPQIPLPAFTSLLPLQQENIDAIRQGLYTVRFVVSHGKATSYFEEGSPLDKWSPSMPGIPDGTYEFYYGKAYQVGWGGHLTELDDSHPLPRFATEHIQELFNLGIDMNTAFSVRGKEPANIPSRFAYFRDGDFYAMGTKIMSAKDPLLETFIAREKEKEQNATAKKPYLGFLDHGAPYRDGKIDVDFIRSFGFTIPEKHYLALGDNYARSSDSRFFGFVPQQNLKGAPSWIFFPPGPRWGPPLQADYPFLNLPRLIIWSLAALCLIGWWLFTRLRIRKRVFNQS